MRTRLHHLVEESAREAGDRPALTHGDRTLDYAALWQETLQASTLLSGLGVQRGERVAVFLDKRVEAVAAIFGTSVLGAVFVPINPVFKPAQVKHILRDSGARVLVTSAERWRLLRDAVGDDTPTRDILLVGECEGATAGSIRLHQFNYPARSGAVEPSETPRGVDVDVAAIFYTSGSTGRPKGVVLTHRNLLVGAESVSTYLGNRSDDVILAVLPLSFDAGFSQLTTAMAVGAHVVLMTYLVPGDVVRLCAEHQVTGLTCVAPLWIQLADAAWPAEASQRLRYFANTGGRMPRATLDRLRALFPQARPFLMYGLTEAFRSTYLDPNEVDRRPDSIGKAIPNAEILVVRSDGSLCGPGEEGELVHRGPLVALGYWNDPERTALRFRPPPGPVDAWRSPEVAVWSGDTVVADDEGYLYFVGRADEMIKTSGYRVSPSELEEVAYASGLVRDAVALGVPDVRLGQRIVLLVTPRPDEQVDPDRLRQVLRRELPLFMVPAEIVVRPELPYSPNGKFDRALLRERVGDWMSSPPSGG